MTEILRPAQIPTEDDLRLIVNESGYANTSHPELLVNVLNDKAPVVGRFTVREIPQGLGVPLVVRQQWVDLSLPVRCTSTDFEGGVPILAIEALEELKKAGRMAGYEWWRRDFEADWKNTPAYNPTFPNALVYTNFLTFSDHEGILEWGASQPESIM
jgi:hypothetical protein